MNDTPLSSPLIGTWHIVAVDEQGEPLVSPSPQPHITIAPNGEGRFQFDATQGVFWVDEEDVTFFDTDWQGDSDGHEVYGEIFAEIEEEEMTGTIIFDNDDEFVFHAVKST